MGLMKKIIDKLTGDEEAARHEAAEAARKKKENEQKPFTSEELDNELLGILAKGKR